MMFLIYETHIFSFICDGPMKLMNNKHLDFDWATHPTGPVQNRSICISHRHINMKNRPKKRAPEQIAPDSDEHIAYIAGYTEGGVPYGVTWEEMEEIEHSAAAPHTGTPPPQNAPVSLNAIAQEMQAIENDWYRFKDEAYKEIAQDWCEENGITWRE
jgi:hypothetical protein